MNPIETERLTIRPWSPNDAEGAFAIYGDPEIHRYLGAKSKPEEDVDSQRAMLERVKNRHLEMGYTQRGLGFWCCEERETGRILGGVLLMPLRDVDGNPFPEIEVGWHFGQFAWGHGFATEAAQAVMKYGFEQLSLDTIYAVAFEENYRSTNVMKRLGMTFIGTTDKYHGHEMVLFEKTKGS